jgi:3-dehydroquinate dehydratase
MEALIPADFVEERNKALGLALTAISNSNSTKKEKEKAPSAEQTKADVVEIAADYIKMLRATLDEKTERMDRLVVAGSDVSV